VTTTQVQRSTSRLMRTTSGGAGRPWCFSRSAPSSARGVPGPRCGVRARRGDLAAAQPPRESGTGQSPYGLSTGPGSGGQGSRATNAPSDASSRRFDPARPVHHQHVSEDHGRARRVAQHVVAVEMPNPAVLKDDLLAHTRVPCPSARPSERDGSRAFRQPRVPLWGYGRHPCPAAAEGPRGRDPTGCGPILATTWRRHRRPQRASTAPARPWRRGPVHVGPGRSWPEFC